MSLRDRLLALLRDPTYSPANEFELSRRLELKKKDRASLAHEVRALLKSGDFVRAANGRIGPRSRSAEKNPAEQRKIFVPTRRGASMPPPEIKEPSPVQASPRARDSRSRASQSGTKRGQSRPGKKPHRETTPRAADDHH